MTTAPSPCIRDPLPGRGSAQHIIMSRSKRIYRFGSSLPGALRSTLLPLLSIRFPPLSSLLAAPPAASLPGVRSPLE